MDLSAMRIALPVLFFGFLCPIAGQTRPPVSSGQSDNDTLLYESFFSEVARLKSFSDSNPDNTIQIRGLVRTLTIPRMQDFIGLTDIEVELLSVAAADCIKRRDSLLKPRPAIFEARLEQIASGQVSASLARELRDLDQQHRNLILDTVQHLKTAFGDSRFRVLDEYVHSSRGNRDFMPVVGPRSAPPK